MPRVSLISDSDSQHSDVRTASSCKAWTIKKRTQKLHLKLSWFHWSSVQSYSIQPFTPSFGVISFISKLPTTSQLKESAQHTLPSRTPTHCWNALQKHSAFEQQPIQKVGGRRVWRCCHPYSHHHYCLQKYLEGCKNCPRTEKTRGNAAAFENVVSLCYIQSYPLSTKRKPICLKT